MWCDLRDPNIRFPFYGKAGFLTCSSIDRRKLHSKTPKTHLSTAFWSWHSRKFSKIKVFVFPNFLEILFKKNSFYGTLGFLTCFSVDPRKPHSKIPKTTSLYSTLKMIFPEIFKNENFRFSQYSQKFFFRLMPRFPRSPHKLLRHFEISW